MQRREDLAAVTGADRSYFLMACLLLESLRKEAPSQKIHVMDFGLSKAQRRYLRSRGVLLARPSAFAEGTHPYILKTRIEDYLKLAGIRPVTIAWIDADMIAVGPLDSALAALPGLMKANGAEIAISPDGNGTVGAVAGLNLPHLEVFRDLIHSAGTSPHARYYNSGIFLASPKLLSTWARLAASTPMHTMFDQNLLNVVIQTTGDPVELASASWNFHGDFLAEASSIIAREDKGLAYRGEPVFFAHPTSLQGAHHSEVDLAVRFEGGALRGRMKLFRDPRLRAIQEKILNHFLDREARELARWGCFGDAEGAQVS